MKVKEYIEAFNKLIEKYPEAIEMEVIYSHDDEGNEYQKVYSAPAICQIENPSEYRFLELVGFFDSSTEDIALEDCNAVIIN